VDPRHPAPIQWTRVIPFGLGAAAILGLAAAAGLSIYVLQSENRSLKGAIESYQQQIARAAQYSR